MQYWAEKFNISSDRLKEAVKAVGPLVEDVSKYVNDNKQLIMPWYNGNFPPSYKNQPEAIREKTVEIANELLLNGTNEGIAIATGLKKAREFFKDNYNEKSIKNNNHGKISPKPR